jgi:hypothetical protein
LVFLVVGGGIAAEPGAAPDRGRHTGFPWNHAVAGGPGRSAWRFQQGESPCQGRVNHPPVPSVAVVEEVHTNLNETTEAYTGIT